MRFCIFSTLFLLPYYSFAQTVGERMYTFVNQTTEVIDHIEAFPPAERGSYNLLAGETFNTLNPYGNKIMKMPPEFRDKCAFIVIAFDRKGNRYELPSRDYCFFAGWIEFKPENKVVTESRRDERTSTRRTESDEREGLSIRLPNINLRGPRRENPEHTQQTEISSGFMNKYIKNESAILIEEVYLVPAKRDSSLGWSENLAETILKPQQTIQTTISAGDGCYYDLKVLTPFYKPYQRANINLCRATNITLLDEHFEKAENVLEAVFDNRTGKKIEKFYLKEATSEDWGEDLMGAITVSADFRFLTFLFQKTNENCLFDVKLFSGRNEIILEKTDLCTGNRIIVRNP